MTPTRAPRPSTYVCKRTMAVTGLLFAVFVAVHMVGNLKAYFGAKSYNSYSLWLRTAFYPLLPHEGLLWIMRVVLGIALVLHVVAALMLWVRGRRFRGTFRRRSYAAWSARSMLSTGVVLLLFVIFHILDLTLGRSGVAAYQPATPTQSFAYQNMVASLSRPLVGGFYLFTMLVLGLHLAHGIWTTATDLGVTGHRTRAAWQIAARVLSIAVVLGNASLPIAIWVGVLS